MHPCSELFATIKIYVLQTNTLVEKETRFAVTRSMNWGVVGEVVGERETGWRQKKENWERKKNWDAKNETVQSLFIDIVISLAVIIFWFNFLTGGNLLYNVVTVSAIQQCESTIIIHISPSSWAFLPSPHPTSLDHHRAPGWAPCDIKHTYIYMESRKLVLMSLFARKEWRHSYREQTCGHSRGRREWTEMEKVA